MITTLDAMRAVGATMSLAVCAILAFSVLATRHEGGRLRREIALAQLEQHAMTRALAAEREQRAAGLLESVRRPVAPELPLILRRLPPAVQVEVIRATPEYWHITGVPHATTGSQARLYEVRLPRPAITVAEATDATPSARVVP